MPKPDETGPIQPKPAPKPEPQPESEPQPAAQARGAGFTATRPAPEPLDPKRDASSSTRPSRHLGPSTPTIPEPEEAPTGKGSKAAPPAPAKEGEEIGKEYSGAPVYAAPSAQDDPDSTYEPVAGTEPDQSVLDPADGSEKITPMDPHENIFKSVRELNQDLYAKVSAAGKDYWYAVQLLKTQLKLLPRDWVKMRDSNRSSRRNNRAVSASSAKSEAASKTSA